MNKGEGSEGGGEGVIPLWATYYKSPFEESSRPTVGVRRADERTDSMICGENVGVVATEVRSPSLDGEIEFESVGSSSSSSSLLSRHTH